MQVRNGLTLALGEVHGAPWSDENVGISCHFEYYSFDASLKGSFVSFVTTIPENCWSAEIFHSKIFPLLLAQFGSGS